MFWKLYTWFFIIFSVIGFIYIAGLGSLPLIDIFGLIMNFFSGIALYAFTYSKPLLTLQTWKVIFWLTVANFIESILALYILPEELSTRSVSFMQSKISGGPTDEMFSWLLAAPAVYAIYKLAYPEIKPKSSRR